MDEAPQDSPIPDSTARAAVAFATLFGVGYAPFAPGTVASVVALPLAWVIAALAGRFVLLLAAILACAIGAWACELYVQARADKDPSECVIDELAGQWIVCAFAPHTLIAYALAFVLFRIFDITKLWPINEVERRVPGGLGIMADDVVAAIFGGIIITVLAAFGVL
jgi:phosphatidylglycerophosphatase A